MSITAPVPVSSQETSTQPFLVRRAAVLGAGTMGSRIAAHLANAGIPSLLLDMVPKDGAQPRNKLALAAIDALGKSKPAAFYEPGLAAFITPGNFEDDLPKLAAVRLGDRSRRRESRNQAHRCWSAWCRTSGRAPC